MEVEQSKANVYSYGDSSENGSASITRTLTYIIYISFLVNCPTPMALRLANEERVRWTLIYANGNQSQGELR